MVKNHAREWFAIALGSGMIVAFVVGVREVVLVLIGAVLVIVGVFGAQLRRLTVDRKGLALETWKLAVAERVVQTVTGRVDSIQPPGRAEAQGTVTPPGDRQITAADSGQFSEKARVDVIEELAAADTPEGFADRLLQVKARADACRQLRDLLDELRIIISKTTSAAAFDFRDLPHRRWDALVPEYLRRDAPDVYTSCEDTYELLAHLNEGSAEVRRRGQVRQDNEGDAKSDVSKEVAPLHSAATATHAALDAHIARVCR